MKAIFAHEYTIRKTIRQGEASRLGVSEIIIRTVSEKEEGDSIEAVEAALAFFDNDINIFHKCILQGYTNE